MTLNSKFDIEHDSWKREKELLAEEAQQLSHQLQVARDLAHQSELSLSEVREQVGEFLFSNQLIVYNITIFQKDIAIFL